MSETSKIDLIKIPQSPEPEWWCDSDKRLSEIFFSGDALLCSARNYGIDASRLKARYRAERPEGSDQPDLPEVAIDKECEIIDVSQGKDGKLILITNPTVRALRDIYCDTEKWQSALIVSARDYEQQLGVQNSEARGA